MMTSLEPASPESRGSPRALVDPRLVYPDLEARTVDGALFEMAKNLMAAGVISDPVELAQRLRKRENDGCTGLGGGIAIPHCRVKDLREVVLSVALSAGGIDFGARDGVPVTLLFLLLSPQDAPAQHLQALARLSRLVRRPGLVEEVRSAGSGEAILRVLQAAEAAASAVAPA